ncbi:hypothetical protein OEZ85_006145 [Tetradesmus obliquus]|uniref:Peptidase S8/S53 domain-containing protein n=1 Tax=Tetradesmus obliquus TaxID=3088 RepID=A0ABY8UL15_TETOB|nr:hypothetical protein OEZ85_006145 [Tetradesmus obliquus]
MPLSRANFTKKGALIGSGTDMEHNNVKGQVDVANSATFSLNDDNPPAPPGGVATFDQGTVIFGIMAANWSPYDGQSDTSGIAGVVGPAYGNIVRVQYAHPKSAEWDAQWMDMFEPVCAAGGIIIVPAGQDIEYNNETRGRDIADPYGDGLSAVYPAAMASLLPNCMLAVAATSRPDTASPTGQVGDPLMIQSCYGQGVRIAAPAAPFVTGVALLLRNLFPAATNKQVVTCLVTSADKTVTPAQPGGNINGGMLNALAAYNCLAAAGLDCSAQQLQVPACVDKTAGKDDKSCKASSSVFCLPVSGPVINSACAYPLRPAGAVCGSVTVTSAPTRYNATVNVTENGQQWTSCIWNMAWVKGRTLIAKRNSSVTLEAFLSAGPDPTTGKIFGACTAYNSVTGKSAKLMTRIKFGIMERCPAGVNFKSLQLAGQRPLKEEQCGISGTQGKNLSMMYSFNVGNPAGARMGLNCRNITVATSDGVVSTLLLRLAPF